MYTLPRKRWMSQIHMPNRHSVALKFEHMVHDERFWPIVIMVAVIAVLALLVIWAGIYSEAGPEQRPVTPFPYNF